LSAGGSAAEEGGSIAERLAASCGGASFAAGTKVLLASGLAVPIASLKAGEKVLATNTKNSRTRAETVTAVLVHHDTDRYDLRVQTPYGTGDIDTTTSHLFWDVTQRKWVKAGELKYGDHLRTPSGGTATLLGGYIPRQATGWMWDLTISGDHDFYIDVATTAVLVHNCTVSPGGVGNLANGIRMSTNDALDTAE
jgi:Pretoxin HINT domain